MHHHRQQQMAADTSMLASESSRRENHQHPGAYARGAVRNGALSLTLGGVGDGNGHARGAGLRACGARRSWEAGQASIEEGSAQKKSEKPCNTTAIRDE